MIYSSSQELCKAYAKVVYSNSPIGAFTDQLSRVLGFSVSIRPYSLFGFDLSVDYSDEDLSKLEVSVDELTKEPLLDLLFYGNKSKDDSYFEVPIIKGVRFDDLYRLVNFAFLFNSKVAECKFHLTKETN